MSYKLKFQGQEKCPEPLPRDSPICCRGKQESRGWGGQLAALSLPPLPQSNPPEALEVMRESFSNRNCCYFYCLYYYCLYPFYVFKFFT